MKIQESDVQLSATHEAKRSQSLEMTTEREFKRIFEHLALSTDEQRMSERQKLQALLQSLIDAILAAMDGKKCGENFAACEELPAEPAAARSGIEINWKRTVRETVSESEKTTVCGKGTVTTCDGRAIAFDYTLAMERNFNSEKVEANIVLGQLTGSAIEAQHERITELDRAALLFDLLARRVHDRGVGARAAIGLIVTIALEYWATQIGGRWEYAEAMPRLPLLGTGLAPLLQWLLIPPLVIWLVRRQIP